MKIDEIEAFAAVVRCQSISQAAQALDLTQPAITRRIQNFEESLGTTLLDRNTKPPRPTAMGRRVYEQCREILKEVESLRQLVAGDTPPDGALRLGVVQLVGDIALLGALQTLQQQYPELQTQVSTSWSSDLLARLQEGQLDAAAVLFPEGRGFPDELLVESLADVELAVVARRGDFNKRSYRLADCNERGWILNPDGCGFRATLQRLLAAQGLTLDVNLETIGAELQLGLVASGMGLGLIPLPLLERSASRDQLQVLKVSDFSAHLQLSLLRPRLLGKLQAPVKTVAGLLRQAFTPVLAGNA